MKIITKLSTTQKGVPSFLNGKNSQRGCWIVHEQASVSVFNLG